MPYVDNVARKEKFVREHPEWTVTYNKTSYQFEAVNEKEEGFSVVHRDLGPLIDRLYEIVSSL